MCTLPYCLPPHRFRAYIVYARYRRYTGWTRSLHSHHSPLLPLPRSNNNRRVSMATDNERSFSITPTHDFLPPHVLQWLVLLHPVILVPVWQSRCSCSSRLIGFHRYTITTVLLPRWPSQTDYVKSLPLVSYLSIDCIYFRLCFLAAKSSAGENLASTGTHIIKLGPYFISQCLS